MFLLAVLVTLYLPGTAYTQQNTPVAHPEECIKIELIADSDKLTPESSIALVVRIHNLCRERIKFGEPSFLLSRAQKGRFAFGDEFRGLILRSGSESFDDSSRYLDPKSRIQFVLDTHEIRWKSMISSIDVLTDRFKDLEETDYYLWAVIFPEIPTNAKASRLVSNSEKVYNSIK